MVHISGSIVVERPVEEVFDFVADSRNEPSYNPAMTECRLLTGEPVGVGSRFASTLRRRSRELTMVSETTAFDRPRRLESTTTGAGTVVTGSVTFDRVGSSTRLTWDWQVRPTRWMRLLTPLLVLIGGRFERSIWTGLKDLLESSPRTPGGPPSKPG